MIIKSLIPSINDICNNDLSDNKIINCSECLSNELIKEDGYLLCHNCGLILREILSKDAEWTNYSNEVNNSRCGPSQNEINPYSEQLSTFVSKGSKSFITKNGKYISSDISRLHIQQNYNGKQKSFDTVQNVFDNIDFGYTNNVITTCKKLWSEIMKTNKIVRSGPRKGLIANCVYYSCVINNYSKSISEICNDINITNKDFNKGNKIFMALFKDTEWYPRFFKESNVETFFNRYCSILSEDNIIKDSFIMSRKCIQNYENFKHLFISFTVKTSIIGILYYTCINENIMISKSYISNKFEICIPTIMKVINKINEERIIST